MSVDEWWDQVKDSTVWADVMRDRPWDGLWPGAQNELEKIFERWERVTPQLNPETIFNDQKHTRR
jgi:hypothetical protein